MPLRFASLGSGSSGNGLVVECGRTRVMMDCGFSVAETRERLERSGLAPSSLAGIVVTHEHDDHLGGVAAFAKKHAVPVYLTRGTGMSLPEDFPAVLVRYIDPEADAATRKDEGWTDKLMFWKAPPKRDQPQYRIHVGDAGAGMSQVQVQNAQGAPETSTTGRRILALLFEQLK